MRRRNLISSVQILTIGLMIAILSGWRSLSAAVSSSIENPTAAVMDMVVDTMEIIAPGYCSFNLRHG